ncbi:MAG TPA: A/G-specific adenine glycosylase [Anaerolineales bacterium]|nr:A/G-specific adenine glycosylase [Anaerolineales bacterium]
MKSPRFASDLLNWYRQNGRTLPWRVPGVTPYAVWVSEIMLQQTRVETVIPYYEKWMQLFPNVFALACASEQEVLRAWEGLGYYSRARNLHKAAKIVVSEYKGVLPRDLDALLALPGVGRYTAGAIASIAFGIDLPILDGNVKRVYARLFDLTEPVNSREGEQILWEIAASNLPAGRAGEYNQALMDLGAMICIPRKPRCSICPLARVCKAYRNGTQELRPVKEKKREVPHYFHVAAVIVRNGKVLLAQRPSSGLLGGMWEFPKGRVDGDPVRAATKALKTEYRLRLRVKRFISQNEIGVFHHAYTHFKVTVHAVEYDLVAMPRGKNLKWIPLEDLGKYPMGRVDRLIAQRIVQRVHT